MRFPMLFAGSLALMLAVSCTNPVCGCPPSRDAAFMHGRVTDPSGAPVQSAVVTAELLTPGCTESLGEMARVQTQADGTYRTTIYSAYGTRPGDCLQAHATPPATLSRLRTSDTVAFAVDFAVDTPRDTVRVDLVLRAQ